MFFLLVSPHRQDCLGLNVQLGFICDDVTSVIAITAIAIASITGALISMADFQVMHIPITFSFVTSYPGTESRDLQKFPSPQPSFLFQLHILV